jgi:long-chain fatty acid transport protein
MTARDFTRSLDPRAEAGPTSHATRALAAGDDLRGGRTWLLTLSAAILTTLLMPPATTAQGLGVYTHSACMLGRAAAGVADPCADGSAIFYGPAALALQPGALAAGVVPIHTKSTFTFDSTGARFESREGTAWVPHAWATFRPAPRVGVGVGLWAPYGLKTEWPLSFEGRFTGYDNKLASIYIQPTIAYQAIPRRLALGAGLDIVRGSVEIHQRRDLATTLIPGTTTPFAALGVPLGTDFADLALDLDAWTAGFHVGVEAILTDRLSLGARYLHTAHLDLDEGTATFRQIETRIPLPPGNPFGLPPGTPIDAVLAPLFAPGGPLSDQEVSTDLTLPNQFVVGLRFLAAEPFRILFDYQWTGWRHFDQAALDFQRAPADTLFLDFHNTSTFRLGGDYRASSLWAIRAGIIYNNAAEPDVSVSPLLPEARRWTFSTGLGYRIADRFYADAGIEYVTQADRRGHVRPRTSRAQTAAQINRGIYESHALAVGVTLWYRLGTHR